MHSINFNDLRAVTLDLDGVVWRDDTAMPGVPGFFLFLKQRNIPYMFLSNNSTKSLSEYIHKLESFKIPIDEAHMLNSGVVAADYLRQHYAPGTPIYVIGSESLAQVLTAGGCVVDPKNARAVVVGLDRNLTYEKLKIGGQRILAGAEFIATNADATFPLSDGIAPGAGTIVAALQKMTGVTPKLMGKPERIMFETALHRLGSTAEQTLMIGDRLDTDILGAQQVGIRTALVLTGISRREDVGAIQPDAIYESLGSLWEGWQQAL